jgi:engulfment/cell motility protein 1
MSASYLQPSSRPRSATTLVPTNTVSTLDGITVRVRIDPALTVADVVRQLCVSLKVPGPPADYALRDPADVLLTNENMRGAIAAKSALRLVKAPAREAAELVERLHERDEKSMKMTLFTLQKYITVRARPLPRPAAVADSPHRRSRSAPRSSTTRASPPSPPSSSPPRATRSPTRSPRSSTSSSSTTAGTRSAPPSSSTSPASSPPPSPSSTSAGPRPRSCAASSRWTSPPRPARSSRPRPRARPRLLDTVVARLGSGETALAQYSLMLINSLLAHASERHWDEFVAALERLHVRRAVVRLMGSLAVEELSGSVLDFQANMVRLAHRQKTTLVEPAAEPAHAAALDAVWRAAQLPDDTDELGVRVRWRQLGFESEDVGREFGAVGVLGLHCLRAFVDADPAHFARVVREQAARARARRCPLGPASNEVVELLAEHWAIYAGSAYAAVTAFQPLFLSFPRVHACALAFWLRMWAESGASAGDFARVGALVRSQVRLALRHESTRA